MRVLQINSVCGIGSTGRIASDLHHMLLKENHESIIAFGRKIPKNCEDNIRIGNKTETYFHVARTRFFDQHGFGSKKATQEFIEKIKSWNPDIIHLHNIHGYYINIEILFEYLKEVNKPVVWTLHDCWSFTGHCVHFEYIGCEKWETGCYNCPQKKEYPSSFLFDNSKQNYLKKKDLFTSIDNLTIITPSKWLENLVKQSFMNIYPIRVINNAIDLDVFKPTESNFRSLHNLNDKYIILGVANTWSHRKGLSYFYELNELLEPDEKIVLLGLSKAQINDLPKGILGLLSTENVNELVEIYSSADVYVNFTLEEVFGMTNIEATACGTPVITFNTGGCPETINKYNGRVVAQKDVLKALAEIRNLKREPLSHKLISNSIKADFKKETFFQNYYDIYSELNKNV